MYKHDWQILPCVGQPIDISDDHDDDSGTDDGDIFWTLWSTMMSSKTAYLVQDLNKVDWVANFIISCHILDSILATKNYDPQEKHSGSITVGLHTDQRKLLHFTWNTIAICISILE